MTYSDHRRADVYAPPRAALEDAAGRRAFPDYATKQLRRLYNHSHSVRALAVLWLLVALALVAAAFTNLGDPGSFLLLAALGGFYLSGAVGTLQRKAWARFLGILLCVVMMIGFPLGTIIGLLGIVAFAAGGPLFGLKPMSHRALKEEISYRKAHGID